MNRFQLISRALWSNSGAAVRAEDLREYPKFFVDPIDTYSLEQNTNQLIYGRGGSGKTLMLGALNDRISSRFPDRRVMSYFYSATDFRRSLGFGASDPVAEKTHAFFHSFIERLALDIFQLADSILMKPKWLDSLSLSGAERAAKRNGLETLVLQLLEASGYGSPSPSPASIFNAAGLHTLEQRGTARAGTGGASVRVTPAGAGVDVSGTLRAQRTSAKMAQAETAISYHDQWHFNPAMVRRLLDEILDLLELDYIVIFIDEWVSLAECQVEFAARLRQCLFNDHRIGIKIAVDQYDARLNNGGHGANFRGLEIERDIVVAVDLDYPFRDPNRSAELFAHALYRRLLHFEQRIEEAFGPPPLSDYQPFLDTIFLTRQAFHELCAGAQGLCRDFHLVFQQCSKELASDLSRTNRIDVEAVRRAIIARTAAIYRQVEDNIDANALLYKIINPYIRVTESPYFLMESRPTQLRPVIHNLQSKRVIHRVDSGELHPSIRGEYDCFEISRAIFLDLMRASEFSSDQEIDQKYDPSEVGMITSQNKSQYILDVDALSRAIEHRTLLLCPDCGQQFPSDDKAYQRRQMCPHCYADVPATLASHA